MKTWQIFWRRMKYTGGAVTEIVESAMIKADNVYLDNGAIVFTRLQKAASVLVAAYSEGAWDYVQEVTPGND